MSLTQHGRADDGTYAVSLTGRRMREGSRWRIAIDTEAFEDPYRTFSRRATDAGWSVTTRFGPTQYDDDYYFGARVHERGSRHSCLVVIHPRLPAPTAAAECSNRRGVDRYVLLTARRRDDDTLRIRFEMYENRRPRRWRIELTAKAPGASQTVLVIARTRFQYLSARADLDSVGSPRLQAVATRPGLRCRIGLNPPDRL